VVRSLDKYEVVYIIVTFVEMRVVEVFQNTESHAVVPQKAVGAHYKSN